MRALPRFDRADYASLVASLKDAGYALVPVGASGSGGRTLHLRHDLDFFVEPALAMARIEQEHGARATYYVLLTGPYNPSAPAARRILREIVARGHDVGLHYDLEAFPSDLDGARAELEGQIAALGAITGEAVRTISTHQPSLGGEDPFRSLPGLVHPHDPLDTRPLLYVSDSCRGWRDESLLSCFGPNAPERVMLLTHPELWLDGAVDSRETYLETVLEPAALAPLRRYYEEEVSEIWHDHAGGRAHDARSGIAWSDAPTVQWPGRGWFEANLAAFEARFADFDELPWTRAQILRDVPGKWEHSVVALRSAATTRSPLRRDDVLGFSFNSLREGRLYVHAFFVAPEARGKGLGSVLLAAIRGRAADLGLAEVGLRVDRDNPRGLRFWVGRGCSVVSVDPQGSVVLTVPSA